MRLRVERDRQHARDCAEMADSTTDPHLRRIFLELEKQWLQRVEEAEEKSLWRRILRKRHREARLPT